MDEVEETSDAEINASSLKAAITQISRLAQTIETLITQIAEDKVRAKRQRARDWSVNIVIVLMLALGIFANRSVINQVESNKERIVAGCEASNATKATVASVFVTLRIASIAQLEASHPPIGSTPEQVTEFNKSKDKQRSEAVKFFSVVSEQLAATPC